MYSFKDNPYKSVVKPKPRPKKNIPKFKKRETECSISFGLAAMMKYHRLCAL